ncbi:hypothetical protein EDB87DRAFT_1607530 [Lactarius vividus]|nr:hypothetical protein EDB87DRAFT_1607530 [Lactarius vividus]
MRQWTALGISANCVLLVFDSSRAAPMPVQLQTIARSSAYKTEWLTPISCARLLGQWLLSVEAQEVFHATISRNRGRGRVRVPVRRKPRPHRRGHYYYCHCRRTLFASRTSAVGYATDIDLRHDEPLAPSHRSPAASLRLFPSCRRACCQNPAPCIRLSPSEGRRPGAHRDSGGGTSQGQRGRPRGRRAHTAR